jgi:predicted RNase H-like nuclease (RuvC/YqgF family)
MSKPSNMEQQIAHAKQELEKVQADLARAKHDTASEEEITNQSIEPLRTQLRELQAEVDEIERGAPRSKFAYTLALIGNGMKKCEWLTADDGRKSRYPMPGKGSLRVRISYRQ